MLYLGQAVSHKGEFTDNKKVPAIFTGYNSKDEPVILALIGKEIHEFSLHDGTKSMDVIREKCDEAPTGWRIYYGSTSKRLFEHFKLKRPSDEVLKEEFGKIAKMIEIHEKKKNK